MKLKKVHIKEFQSIRDSSEFEVGDVTCLVGKNEAGKTAVLKALYRLNPLVERDGVFSVTDDYPRWEVEDYRMAVEAKQRQPATVVTATFELDDEDARELVAALGTKALRSRLFTLSKGYEKGSRFVWQFDKAAALEHLATEAQLTPEHATLIAKCTTIPEILKVLGGIEPSELITRFTAVMQEAQQAKGLEQHAFDKYIRPRIPKFLYFDEYYQLAGCENIEKLMQRKQEDKLAPADLPLLGLINLARLKLEDLINPARTRDLKNRLEGSGNFLTQRIIKYWSQNRYLNIRFDVRNARKEDPAGMREGTNIWGEIYDTKHRVTTELGTRSKGFVWFFSFLAWYSDVKQKNQPVILLLDEPGLTLHAKAQEDLLRYFDAEVQGHHQLIYTTHSPFMVDPRHFERVRIVQDLSIDTDAELPMEKQGTKVMTDVLEASGDSLFPLQGALGYEIYQTLFIGPNSLIVEGASDLLYIEAMRALLEGKSRTGLGQEWTITPVGGADKVPTFVALIGAQKSLNVATLIDIQMKDRQAIDNLYKRKLLHKKKVLTFADFTGGQEADIEDMFDLDFYLSLVNAEFAADLARPVTRADLDAAIPRVVARLERHFSANPTKTGVKFNHYRPARYLSENLSALKSSISESACGRFEEAFKRLNALL